MHAIRNFWSRRECIDADADAAAAEVLTPAAAAAAESLADYLRLTSQRPSVPPAPQGSRPQQRLRSYHPIPQRAEGNVIVVNGLPCLPERIGYAIWACMRGGISAEDVRVAMDTCTAGIAHGIGGVHDAQGKRPSISIPADYVLPATARAVLGDDLGGAIRSAASIIWMVDSWVPLMTERKKRVERYGTVHYVAGGAIINGGAPDQVANGATPLTAVQEQGLKRWQSIANADCWLETVDAFQDRQRAWDTASETHKDGKALEAIWAKKVRCHPIRKLLDFKV